MPFMGQLSTCLPGSHVDGRTYIKRLTCAVQEMHACTAIHVESVPLTESFQGVVWSGFVEVFHLEGHPRARTCYGWATHDDGKEHFTAVLRWPPINWPQLAVQAAIASQIQQAARIPAHNAFDRERMNVSSASVGG